MLKRRMKEVKGNKKYELPVIKISKLNGCNIQYKEYIQYYVCIIYNLQKYQITMLYG